MIYAETREEKELYNLLEKLPRVAVDLNRKKTIIQRHETISED